MTESERNMEQQLRAGSARDAERIQQDLRVGQEQYTVRGPNIEQGMQTGWNKEQIEDIARKASQLRGNPEVAVTRFSDDSPVSKFKGGEQTYDITKDRNAPDHRDTRHVSPVTDIGVVRHQQGARPRQQSMGYER